MARGAHPKESIIEAVRGQSESTTNSMATKTRFAPCRVNPELTRARNGVDGLGIVQGCLQFVQPNPNVWNEVGRKEPQEEHDKAVGSAHSEYGENEPNPFNDSHFNEEDRN